MEGGGVLDGKENQEIDDLSEAIEVSMEKS